MAQLSRLAGTALSWIALTLLAATPICTALASRSPTAVAAAFGLVCILLAISLRHGAQLDRKLLGLIGALLAVLLLVSVTAEAGWEPSFSRAVKSGGLLLAGALGGIAVAGGRLFARPSAKWSVVACFVVGFAILWLDAAAGEPVYRLVRGLAAGDEVVGWTFDRTAIVLAVLAWPTIACLPASLSVPACLLLSALMMGVLFFTESQTGPVVVAAAFIAYWLARALPRAGAALLAGASALYIAAAPWLFTAFYGQSAALFGDWKAASAGARLDIWKVAGQMALERPLTGWGVNALRQMDDIFSPDELFMTAANHTAAFHAHNFALQTWLDLGIAGVVLVILLISRAFWHFARLAPPHAAAGCAMLMAIMAAGSLNPGLWQGWWLGTIALAVCQFILATRVPEPFAMDQFGSRT